MGERAQEQSLLEGERSSGDIKAAHFPIMREVSRFSWACICLGREHIESQCPFQTGVAIGLISGQWEVGGSDTRHFWTMPIREMSNVLDTDRADVLKVTELHT